MQNTSIAYKEQINKTTRNPSYVEVTFKLVDPQAVTDSTFVVDSEVWYSDVDSIDLEQDVNTMYQTLEHNRFYLDGVGILSPTPPSVFPYMGYIGDEISNSVGEFISEPVITVNFADYFSLVGLTFEFDLDRGEYPSELQIISYKDGVVNGNNTYYPTSSSWVLNSQIPTTDTFNKLEIIIVETNVPYRRARIQSMLFGIVKMFDENNISGVVWTRRIDRVSSKLPVEDFELTFIDKDKEYDPENPSGIYSYIESGQPIDCRWGYDLDNGTIEWIDGASTLTTGEINIDGSTNIPLVTIRSSSRLNLLNKAYDEGLYYPSGINLYDLAEDVLQFANIPLDSLGNVRWTLDTSLQSIYTKSPLPAMPCKDCLQLIANAGQCCLYTDRDGYIIIKPYNYSINDFTFDYSNILDVPSITKYPLLKEVNANMYIYTLGTVNEELLTEEIDVGIVETEFIFEIDSSTDVALVLGAGVTLVGTVSYFTNYVKATLTGTGNVTINGKVLTISTSTIIKAVNTSGEICPVDNVLITNRTYAIEYMTWISNVIQLRNFYKVSDRGYPELDMLDDILAQTGYSVDKEVVLIGNKITYNGALSSESEYVGG